jgi:hypothetical protein
MTEVILLNPGVTDRGPTFHPAKESQPAPKAPQRKIFVLIESFSKHPSNPIAVAVI